MKQQWDAQRYASDVGFVAALGEPLLELLAPQARDRVLDLGCGDGTLSEKIAQSGCQLVCLDNSPEQVEAAAQRGLDARVVDGHALTFAHEFDAVISNAALHWMKRPDDVLCGVNKALVPSGRFIAEMGGAGNVQRIVTGIEAILLQHGRDPHAVNPWYFPTREEYTERLVRHGFDVLSIDTFPRPTAISVDILAWLEIFALSFFAEFSAADRTKALRELRESLHDDLCDHTGNWFVDYVRLRFSAVKRHEI